MSSDLQDFDQLRRLLALKRHEQPPPGYHDRFSREVIARIKAGDAGDEVGAGNWFRRLWTALETKPMFAGALGAGVCAVLISGLLNSEDSGMATAGANPALPHGHGGYGGPAMASVAAEPVSATTEPSLTTTAASTDAAALNSLFGFNPQMNVRSVNWVPAGN